MLSLGKAARIIGMSPRTLSQYCKRGVLKAHLTPGGHYRVKEDDVRALLTTRKVRDARTIFFG